MGSGCPQRCFSKKERIKNEIETIDWTLKEFDCPKTKTWIEKVLKQHPSNKDKFDYSKCKYIKSSMKVQIKCKNCKTLFAQVAANHLNGSGCSKCKWSQIMETKEKYFKFLFKIRAETQDMYDYSHSYYNGYYKSMKIQCKKCQSFFYVKCNKHLWLNQDCPKCKVTPIEIQFRKVLKQLNINDYSTEKMIQIPQNTYSCVWVKEECMIFTFQNIIY